MRMEKIIIAAFFLCGIFSALPAGAADSFSPWGSSVKTGDALYGPANMHEGRPGRKAPYGVHGGIQAGAWLMIRFFQVAISPQDGPSCRYHPVCSIYGSQAVRKYGAFLGALLAADRIIRCNPFNPPGEDPLPGTLRDEK